MQIPLNHYILGLSAKRQRVSAAILAHDGQAVEEHSKAGLLHSYEAVKVSLTVTYVGPPATPNTLNLGIAGRFRCLSTLFDLDIFFLDDRAPAFGFFFQIALECFRRAALGKNA